MELHEIMTQIKGTSDAGLQKTANVSTPDTKTAKARDKLLNALNDVLTPMEKTATAQSKSVSATSELVKMATDLANSESAALMKEAQLYGAAVADGFMARLGQYEMAVAGEKTASASGTPTQAEFEKFAAENPDLVKQAVDLGYLHGMTQIEQLKTAAFEKGYADTRAQITELQKTAEGRDLLQKVAAEVNAEDQAERQKVAALEQGYADGRALIAELQKTPEGRAQFRKIAAEVNSKNQLAVELEKLSETPEGREKLAEIKRGYDDTMNELTKMANDTFERGYRDTINVIRAM